MTQQKKVESKPNKSVTLKRAVTIKAIVTEKFKEYMLFEITEGVRQAQLRIEMIDRKLKELALRVDQSGSQILIQQFSAEKVQLQQNMDELRGRVDTIKKLTVGSQFVQGAIEGFVMVSEGDNLYEKLGGMEIITRDGVIEQITPVSKPSMMPGASLPPSMPQ